MAYEPKLDTNTLITPLATAAKSLQSCLPLCDPASGSYQEGTGKSGSFGMWNHPRGHVWNVVVRPASS